MTSIKATCPRDGEVELTSGDVALRVCQQREALSRYEFICPVCSDEVSKPADEHIQALLISAGVAVEALDIPLEALEEHTGAPISYDDLLDFHFALERHSLLAERARLGL
ncbi:MAG TPA: hypothetical protein VFH54_06085 [Mycobacteriales bacterium]|nr:hypothetical protein [Mycobacteriales bacterium]